MIKFILTLSLGVIFISSDADGMRKSPIEKSDLIRDNFVRKFRGEYSVEIEFKKLAELAVGNSLNKDLIERYYVVKKEFEKNKHKFSEYDKSLCLSRIETIEEVLYPNK